MTMGDAMPHSERKRIVTGPRNSWEAQLERMDGTDPTQAGEFEAGLEEGDAGGDKGIDADTGSGGYSGDIVEQGLDEADGEPERPLDAENFGDPRTREGDEYPEESKRTSPDQESVRAAAEELPDDELRPGA